jgi:hypothetical protein
VRATTVFYCPVVGCSWEYGEADLPIEAMSDPAKIVQIQRNMTETVLSTHLLKKHVPWDLMSSTRSYQMFLSGLVAILVDTTHAAEGPDAPSEYAKGQRDLAEQILETITYWRKENTAR